MNKEILVSSEIIENYIINIYRIKSSTAYMNGIMLPDTLIKRTWQAQDSKLVLISEVNGTVKPQQVIPESFEFEDENQCKPLKQKIN